jgi:hypothetical protein
MTETEWLAGTDPAALLTYLVGTGRRGEPCLRHPAATDRKLRLFACACDTNQGSGRRAWWMDALEAAIDDSHRQPPRVLRAHFADPLRWVKPFLGSWPCPRADTQAAMLRCLFGNPWRRPAGLYEPPLWHASDQHRELIRHLARAIYDERRWDDLGILADALEEAGCTDADMLNHCRGPGLHARGCWVVDLLLGKR